MSFEYQCKTSFWSGGKTYEIKKEIIPAFLATGISGCCEGDGDSLQDVDQKKRSDKLHIMSNLCNSQPQFSITDRQ